MQSRFPDLSTFTGQRRDAAPSDRRSNGERQATLPPLPFERLSFLAGLDVIDHFNFDAWFAAVADMQRLSPVEIK